MTDLLTDLGQMAAPRLLAPFACWTLLALLAEGAFRLTYVPAVVRLAVRQTLLFALGPALLLPFLADAIAPTVENTVVQSALAVFELPGVTVGGEVSVADPAWTVWTAVGAFLALALGVGLLSAARLGVAWARLGRHRARLPIVDEGVLADGDRVASESGLRRRPALARDAAAASPYTVGLRRPVVVLPDGLDEASRRLVLAHEFAHVRRHDYAWTVAERAAVALCAAHPLVHLLAAGAALDRECLVDADVIRARPAERRAYADLLLHFAARPAPTLAIGTSSSPLKHRFLAMNHPLTHRALGRARFAGRALAVGLAAVMLLAGFSAASGSSDAFRVESPIVTLDGMESTFAGRVQTDDFRVFGVAVPSYGRFLMSPEPFPGAVRVGSIDGNRISTTVAGHSLIVSSSMPILDQEGILPLYTRFDVFSEDVTLPSGFDLSIGVGASADALARTFDQPYHRFSAARRLDEFTRSRARRAASADTIDVYDVVDEQPVMIGGIEALQEAIVYPRLQKDAGIEGRTFIQFVVSRTGSVRDAQVARSSGDDALDAAALTAVQSMRFTPGKKDGEAVAVRFALPISFRLPPPPPNAPDSPPDAPAPPPNAPAPPPPPPPPPGVDLPQLIGGFEAFQQSLAYPEVAKRAGIEGSAYVKFVVSEDGTTRNIEVVRSAGDDALDAAAVAAVRTARFNPGRKDGEIRPMHSILPIHFKLPAADE